MEGVYQNGNFLPGKSISRREKNQENDFAPSEKFSCYAPAQVVSGRKKKLDSLSLENSKTITFVDLLVLIYITYFGKGYEVVYL